jgi:hypothetical protein
MEKVNGCMVGLQEIKNCLVCSGVMLKLIGEGHKSKWLLGDSCGVCQIEKGVCACLILIPTLFLHDLLSLWGFVSPLNT